MAVGAAGGTKAQPAGGLGAGLAGAEPGFGTGVPKVVTSRGGARELPSEPVGGSSVSEKTMSQSLRSFLACGTRQPWAPACALGQLMEGRIVSGGAPAPADVTSPSPINFPWYQFSEPESYLHGFPTEPNFPGSVFQHSIVFPLTFQP